MNKQIIFLLKLKKKNTVFTELTICAIFHTMCAPKILGIPNIFFADFEPAHDWLPKSVKKMGLKS